MKVGQVRRASAVCLGALLGWSALVATSTQVVAVGEGIVAPASLQAGLQTADRLNPPPPRGPTLPADVQEVLDWANEARVTRGIAPLTYHAQLTAAAQAHAADQYYRDCLTQLSHTGTDGSNPGVRIQRTGLSVRTWGENIACGQRTPASVHSAWMRSPGHRDNILDPSFTHIGISVSLDSDGRPYWVQLFGTPR